MRNILIRRRPLPLLPTKSSLRDDSPLPVLVSRNSRSIGERLNDGMETDAPSSVESLHELQEGGDWYSRHTNPVPPPTNPTETHIERARRIVQAELSDMTLGDLDELPDPEG